MVIGRRTARAAPGDRAKTSKSVRLDDRQGFDHKFNKTGFKCEAVRHLYYYYVKCYEQVLRGKDASSVLTKKDFLRYRRFAECSRLKQLPEGFRSFGVSEKVETLNRLIDEQVDAGAGIVQQFEDVESIQVKRAGKMEVDEGSVAELGPECSISEASFLHGDSLQSVARDFQDNPEGRPPTCVGQVPENFRLCVSEFESWASSYLDILMEVKSWELQGMLLMTKLKDRDICGSLGVDSSNTHIRSRQEEIFSQLQEDITVKDPPDPSSRPWMKGIQVSHSQASKFGENVERGVEMVATTKLHPAVDTLSTASSFIAPPNRCISEALNITPIYTGRLKANLEEIHPRVAGDLQYQLTKPEMEGVGPQVSHPEASDLWGNKQYGGEYLAPVPHSGGHSVSHSGGHSVSQIVPIGHSISAEPLALERTMQEFGAEEQLWDEPASEGSLSPLWTHHWNSPVRYDSDPTPTIRYEGQAHAGG